MGSLTGHSVIFMGLNGVSRVEFYGYIIKGLQPRLDLLNLREIERLSQKNGTCFSVMSEEGAGYAKEIFLTLNSCRILLRKHSINNSYSSDTFPIGT